jgi:YVTN family beta-propeller protein
MGQQLYVANGESDSISVVDTEREVVVRTISLLRPGYKYFVANPNSLPLSPDEATLYVTLGGENAVAVIDLKQGRVVGRIPTAWYPNSVSVSRDGTKLYVVNAKSMPGPNPAGNGGAGLNPTFRNEYILELQKSSLSVIPVPDREALADSRNWWTGIMDLAVPTRATKSLSSKTRSSMSSTSCKRIAPMIRCWEVFRWATGIDRDVPPAGHAEPSQTCAGLRDTRQLLLHR